MALLANGTQTPKINSTTRFRKLLALIIIRRFIYSVVNGSSSSLTIRAVVEAIIGMVSTIIIKIQMGPPMITLATELWKAGMLTAFVSKQVGIMVIHMSQDLS